MERGRIKNGFTLVEIIVSVAALSLICALVLKLFLLSGDVGKRTVVRQHAVFEAVSIMGMIKSMDEAEDIYTQKYFSDALIEKTDEGMTVTALTKLAERDCIIEVKLAANASFSSPDGDYMDLTVTITDDGKTIFTLNGGRYFAKNGP